MEKMLYEELVCLNGTRFSEGREDAEDHGLHGCPVMIAGPNVEKLRTVAKTS
jgi:hypothetical protein